MAYNFDYDVALSFAGEDRQYVENVANILKHMKINVFYDRFEEEKLWGKDLYEYLSEIYYKRARYTIMFISEHYAKKLWTDHERQSMQARAFEENKEYILPARFDDTKIPGILPTVGYISLHNKEPSEFADIIYRKISSNINPGHIKENLDKELRAAEVRSLLEGLKSPTEWFINWRDEINQPTRPPRHWLLNSVFVERELYSEILSDFINGKKKAGITGFLGMGGVGKTYTALKISWELIENHDWEVVWVGLLQQGTEEALDHIANCFGLYFANSLKLEEKITATRKLLNKAIRKFPNLLAVLDNAENFPRLDLLLEALRDIPVLVTSRKRECSDIVPYRKIEPLEGVSAVNYCRSLLAHYNFQIDQSKNDVDDLKKLCATLGGHPLGIRLALSGFIRKPLLEQLKNNRFSLLIDEIQRGKVEVLSSDKAQSDTLDETQLHKSIESTFLWTYEELISEDSSSSQKAAYILLPLMSALGTTSVSKSTCDQGIQYLLNNLASNKKKSTDVETRPNFFAEQEEKSSTDDNGKENISLPEHNAHKIKKILSWLQSYESAFDAGVSQLVDLALVEILDADDQRFALHPLIREFSFHYIEQIEWALINENEGYSHDTYALSSDLIFRMAIEIIGSEHGNEALLDLLPRLKESRQLVEMAISRVKKQYDALYFQDDIAAWPYLMDLLNAALDLAISVGLVKEEVWISLKLGELKARAEFTEGYKIIDAGVKRFIKEKDNKSNDNIPNLTIFDWVYEKHIDRSDILWSCSFNRYYERGIVIVEEIVRHIMQLTRLFLSRDASDTSYTYKQTLMLSRFEEYICKNTYESKPSTLSCINQNLLSNVILDLIDWMNFSLYSGHVEESLSKARSLFDLALNNVSNYKKEGYVISIEHIIDFERNYSARAFEYDVYNRSAFEESVDKIKREALKHGIRGFKIESEYCQSLSKKHFEHEEWIKSIGLADKAIAALREINDSNTLCETTKNELLLIKICAVALANQECKLSNIINEQELIESEVNNKECLKLIPLVYLSKACIENAKGNKNKRNLYATKSEKSYQMLQGHIPPFVRPLLSQWRSWSIPYDQIELDIPASWRISYQNLPDRVRSTIDNRTMVLIRPGIQCTIKGGERWLYPFYIDEEPVYFKALAQYAKENNLQLANSFADDSVLNIGDTLCAEYLSWAGKKMPVKAEVFSAWLQTEKNITPEHWKNTKEMLDGTLKRIESFINTAKLMSMDIRGAYNDETEGFLVSNQQEASDDKYINQLEVFYIENWLTDNDSLMKKFEIKIYSRFQNTDLIDEERFKLAFYLATSLSLSKAEKERVMQTAEKLDEDGSSQLTKEKCSKLIDVFVEEREKFLNLEKEHPRDIQKLLHKTQDELYMIFGVYRISEAIHWDKWHLKVDEVAHTDAWEDQQREHKFTDYKCKKNSNNTIPVLRGVIPVFTQRDMFNLEVI